MARIEDEANGNKLRNLVSATKVPIANLKRHTVKEEGL